MGEYIKREEALEAANEWVSWIVPGERGTKSCAYNSPEALAKNWEAVK